MKPALCAALLAFALTTPASARQIPDHPVLEQILARYEGKVTPGACRAIVDSAFTKIASLENFESGLLLKDLKGGGCRLEFVAVGGKDYVNRDLVHYLSLLSDPEAVSAVDLHVHPAANGEYFRAGTKYRDEIMFSSAAMVSEAVLPAGLYDSLIAKVKEGSAPGFSLSPPSIQDLLVASSESAVPLQYVVINDGGAWIYSLAPGAKREEVFKRIDDIKTYAFMFAMGNQPPGAGNPERIAYAKALFDFNMKDGENRRIIQEWQVCLLALRKPYSHEAVKALLAGRPEAVQGEFREKVAYARRWSALMLSIGFAMEFKPFP